MKKILLFIFVIVLLIPTITFGSVSSGVDLNEKDLIGLKRVDNYVFAVDMSGSMMMKDGFSAQKIILAKKLMAKMVQCIPQNLNIKGSLITLTPNSILADNVTNTEMLAHISKIKDNLPIFGRMTNLESGAVFLNEYLSANKTRKTAVIFVSDGNWNLGENPITELQKVHQENVIFCSIDFANTEKGIAVFKNLEENVEVLPYNIDVNETPCKTASKTIYGVVALPEVYFNFNKSTFKHPKENKEELLKIYEEYSQEYLIDAVKLDGWTDWIGSDEYNLGLSKRRAETVSKVFPELHEIIEGFGKSYKYDNETPYGRAENRRVDVIFE